MGQYYNGEKIGTCENMYYMRLTQARKLAEVGARDDDGISFFEMLHDGVTRWRFPWPDEDGREQARLLYSDVADFERSYELQVPADVSINHGKVWLHGKGYNVELPCIHSEEWRKIEEAGAKLSSGPHYQKIKVIYDAIRDGKRAILFECSACGLLQRASAEDWEKIRAFNVEMTRRPFRTSLHDREGGACVWAQDLEAYARKVDTLDRMRPDWRPVDVCAEAEWARTEAILARETLKT